MGMQGSSFVPGTHGDHAAAWQPGLDPQAAALHGTFRWVYGPEKEYVRDLHRRLFELRQTVQATACWDKVEK